MTRRPENRYRETRVRSQLSFSKRTAIRFGGGLGPDGCSPYIPLSFSDSRTASKVFSFSFYCQTGNFYTFQTVISNISDNIVGGVFSERLSPIVLPLLPGACCLTFSNTILCRFPGYVCFILNALLYIRS